MKHCDPKKMMIFCLHERMYLMRLTSWMMWLASRVDFVLFRRKTSHHGCLLLMRCAVTSSSH